MRSRSDVHPGDALGSDVEPHPWRAAYASQPVDRRHRTRYLCLSLALFCFDVLTLAPNTDIYNTYIRLYLYVVHSRPVEPQSTSITLEYSVILYIYCTSYSINVLEHCIQNEYTIRTCLASTTY